MGNDDQEMVMMMIMMTEIELVEQGQVYFKYKGSKTDRKKEMIHWNHPAGWMTMQSVGDFGRREREIAKVAGRADDYYDDDNDEIINKREWDVNRRLGRRMRAGGRVYDECVCVWILVAILSNVWRYVLI